MQIKHPINNPIMKDQEPTSDQIEEFQQLNPEYSSAGFYTAREYLREQAYKESYGQYKPTSQSWGDFWKSY